MLMALLVKILSGARARVSKIIKVVIMLSMIMRLVCITVPNRVRKIRLVVMTRPIWRVVVLNRLVVLWLALLSRFRSF